MKKALDGLMARHDAISSNLANVDTPGYKPVRVDFEDKLRQALEHSDQLRQNTRYIKQKDLTFNQGMLDLRTSSEKHFGAKVVHPADVRIQAYQENDISIRNDGNCVDIDSEMTEMVKNSLQYQAIAKFQAKHFMSMNEIIKGGGQA